VFHGLGDVGVTVGVSRVLGGLLSDLGDLRGAERFLDFALMYLREGGGGAEVAHVLRELGEVRLGAGSMRGAVAPLSEAMGVFEGLGDSAGVVACLRLLGEARSRLDGGPPVEGSPPVS